VTHDLLCPEYECYLCADIEEQWRCDEDCECELITKVRNDERRQQESRRMAKFGYWHDYRPEMP